MTAPTLLGVLRRIEDRSVETAHRALQNAGQVFRYAIQTGRAERDPSRDLRGALTPWKPQHFASITEPAKVGELLRAISAVSAGLVVKSALLLTPLVFTQPGELRQARWSEFDLDRAEWNIPGERMKMREPHLVPLSEQAVAILREVHALTGRGEYVFTGVRLGKASGKNTTPGVRLRKPISENALRVALKRAGYSGDQMTAHGFRAMARTVLDEVLGFRPDFIEHQLAHTVRDPNTRAYNRTAHLTERRRMMQAWTDYLDALKTGSNVVALRKIA